MKRSIMVIATSLILGVNGWTQPKEIYKSKILIQGTWGTAPGQYGRGLIDDDQFYPTSFAIDENEIIYILDDLNNRVQYYDGGGNLLGVIPIESYSFPAEKQKGKAPGAEASLTINYFGFIDGSLHAVRRFRGESEAVFKLQGAKFVIDDSSQTLAKIRSAKSYESNEEIIRRLLGRDSRFHDKTNDSKDGIKSAVPFFDGYPVGRVIVDGGGNRWIMGISKNGRDEKCSPSGELLFEIRVGGASREVSRGGNYYVLRLYSANSSDADDAFAAKGIQIIKYSLK